VKGFSQEKLVYPVPVWDVDEGVGDVIALVLIALRPVHVPGHGKCALVRLVERKMVSTVGGMLRIMKAKILRGDNNGHGAGMIREW
jgi:hypothetical protein